MRIAAFAAALVAAAAPVSHALAAETLPPLDCSFSTGASWTYSAGKYTRSEPAPLAFGIEGADLDGQTAKLIVNGRAAAKPLSVVRALNAVHFLEVAQEGFLNVTTVYDKDAATGERPAIHSRHLGVLGEPVFAQYAGFCRER